MQARSLVMPSGKAALRVLHQCQSVHAVCVIHKGAAQP